MFEIFELPEESLAAQPFTPTRDGVAPSNDVAFYFYGPETPQYAQGVNAALMKRKGKEGDETLEDLINNQVEIIIACCAGWKGIKTSGKRGKAVEYDPEHLRALLTDPKTSWVRAQAFAFITDESNFLPQNAKG